MSPRCRPQTRDTIMNFKDLFECRLVQGVLVFVVSIFLCLFLVKGCRADGGVITPGLVVKVIQPGPVKPRPGPTPTPSPSPVKSCLCSEGCACGCNEGQPCQCAVGSVSSPTRVSQPLVPYSSTQQSYYLAPQPYSVPQAPQTFSQGFSQASMGYARPAMHQGGSWGIQVAPRTTMPQQAGRRVSASANCGPSG